MPESGRFAGVRWGGGLKTRVARQCLHAFTACQMSTNAIAAVAFPRRARLKRRSSFLTFSGNAPHKEEKMNILALVPMFDCTYMFAMSSDKTNSISGALWPNG